jgi:hypothetical protein
MSVLPPKADIQQRDWHVRYGPEARPMAVRDLLRMVWQLGNWELLGIPLITLAGSALHFAFEWSGYWTPIALMAAVNESVWEHLKLAFWPGVLWAILEYMAVRPETRTFWSVKGYALAVAPMLIVFLFYGYTAALGKDYFLLDIAIFVIAIVAGQLASIRLLKTGPRATRWYIIGIGLLVCQLAAFSTFTLYPPAIGLFEDSRNGMRGIPSPDTAPIWFHR